MSNRTSNIIISICVGAFGSLVMTSLAYIFEWGVKLIIASAIFFWIAFTLIALYAGWKSKNDKTRD